MTTYDFYDVGSVERRSESELPADLQDWYARPPA